MREKQRVSFTFISARVPTRALMAYLQPHPDVTGWEGYTVGMYGI